MAEDDRIDRLIAALERFAQGPVPRRYLVRFPGYGAPDASCVVEAFNSEEAVQAAQLALYKGGHAPNLVRPAKDDDCIACGARLGKLGDQCDKCGRTREQQMNFLYDPWRECL